MGHNRKKNNRHGRNSNSNRNAPHNSSSYTSNSVQPKATQEELQMECLEMYELISNKTQILKEHQKQLNYCYLLSTKWLQDWKQYVGYYNLTQEDPKKYKKTGKKHPGKINADLVIGEGQRKKKFYQLTGECEYEQQISQQDSSQTQQLSLEQKYGWMNVVLNQKKQQAQDYIAIGEKIWRQFSSKYDHVEIKRLKKITQKGSVIYDGDLLQIDVIMVDYLNKQVISTIQQQKTQPKVLDEWLPCLKMQLSELWKLQDLQEFLENYCASAYQTKIFKLWKGHGYSSTGALQRECWNGINKSGQYTQQSATTVQMDQNFTVSCQQLSSKNSEYSGLTLDQFLKSYYTLIIEIGSSHIQSTQIPEGQFEGYCEECVNKKQLTVRCICDRMFYCSDQCRVADQIWHSDLCQQAFQSEDDEQYQEWNLALSAQIKEKRIDRNRKEKKGNGKKNGKQKGKASKHIQNKKQIQQINEVQKLAKPSHFGIKACGLQNLGNTCYMNSVIQALISVQDFVRFFVQNKYQANLDPKQYQDNNCRLVQKYSKMLKYYIQKSANQQKKLNKQHAQTVSAKNLSNKQASTQFSQNNSSKKRTKKEKQQDSLEQIFNSSTFITPWSFKGQVQYFLSTFKGFRQHDANQFLIGLLNTLNDQLKKQEAAELYHTLFKDSFIGMYQSIIQCPDCGLNIKNDQMFTQITLPLKSAQKNGKKTGNKHFHQIVNFVIYKSCKQVVKGKCLITNDMKWANIKEHLKLKKQCIVMACKQGEAGLNFQKQEISDMSGSLKNENTPLSQILKMKRQLIFYPQSQEDQTQVISVKGATLQVKSASNKQQSKQQLGIESQISQFDHFSVVTIGEKQICGQKMKAPYGYPGIVKTNKFIESVGQLCVSLLQNFDSPETYAQALKIKCEYNIEMEKLISQFGFKKKQLQKCKALQAEQISNQSKTEASNSMKQCCNHKQNQSCSEIIDQLVSQQQNLEQQIISMSNQKFSKLLKAKKILLYILDHKKQNGNICSFCSKRSCTGCQIKPDFSLLLSDLFKQKPSWQMSFQIKPSQRFQQLKIQSDFKPPSLQPTLQDSFKLFEEFQQLDQQNAWYCSQCDMMRLALKKMSIKRLPKILILHLNRFKNVERNGKWEKNIKNADPIQYNQVEQFIEWSKSKEDVEKESSYNKKKYRLLSAIIHEGTIDNGHYWAIGLRDKVNLADMLDNANNSELQAQITETQAQKHLQSMPSEKVVKDYYILNDTKIQRTDKIKNKNAYILIYEQIPTDS